MNTLQVLKERGYVETETGELVKATGQAKSDGAAAKAAAGLMEKQRFVIPGVPMGKPRMTRRDKWAKRGCVLRYRDWADEARRAAPANLMADPVRVDWVAYLPIPKSWSKKRRAVAAGQVCRSKPDRDNLDKALLDALWPQDAGVAVGMMVKRWDDGRGPRMEVEVGR